MINNLIPIEFDPFSDDGNDLILPTTDPQQEIFTNILIGGKLANCAYNESVSLIFTGKFRYEIFVRSVNELIKRYHSLRCKFSTDGTSMTILTELTIEVPLIDLTALDSKKQTKAVEEIISGEMNQEFNIFTGPLIRVSVLQLSTEKTQVVLTLHHLIADGWSVGYCMIDLGKFYTAFCTEHEPELEKAESWPDFLNAESEYRKSNEHKLVTQFWLNEFKDSIPVFDLPINKPRPAFRTYEASRIDLLVDAETVKKIKQLGARCGCSFVNTMIAVFEVFLHRICSTNELVTMLPTAGQSVTGFEALIGHCVNLIPLKTSIQDSQSFSEYLKDRKKTLLDQLDHQRISLGELIREINLKRDPSRVPFSPVTFNIDVGMTNHVSFHNLEMEFITNPRIAENSEWFVNCAGNGDTLLIEWTYNKNLFEKKLMELRIREFITLLESIAADPDSQIRYLNILPEDELNTLLIDWNSFFIDFPPGYTINRLFEEQVQQHPDKIALWHNGVQLTYRELDDKANQLAHYLIQQGFKEGMFCGICLERSIEMIIAIYSVMKAGGAYIPLDPAYPPARIEVILQDANAEFIITQSSVKEKISGHTAKEIVYDQLRNELTSQPVNKPDINDDEYRISYVIYTSGSTGKPKGVAIMHHSFISLHAWAKTVYSKEDIAGMLASTSICFDLSVFEMFFTLGFGGRLIIVENALSLAYLPAEINVTFISMVPSAVAELVKMDHGIPDSVKVMNLAGEALSTELVTQLYQATKAERIYDLYGPTEDTYVSTWALRKPDERATIGRPLANSQIYILDKNLQPVPIGVAGELHIGGEGLAKGYLNREDLTNEKFIPNVFSIDEHAKLYKTGDLARFRIDGNIEYLGRIDFQVKFRGFRIELSEIENVLRKHNSVNEVITSVYTDPNKSQQLVAWISLHQKTSSIIEELRQHLKKSVPDYMVPQVFMILDSLPKTPNGKIDRKALPVPEFTNSDTYDSELQFEQLSITEEKLKDIWKLVLNHDKFSLSDNFFTIGGHSLLGVRMFIELEKQMGVNLPLQTLFKAPSIKELAVIIDSKESAIEWKPIVGFRTDGNKIPLFCIHMHNGNIYRWKILEKYLPEDQPIYAIQPRALDPNQKPHRTIEDQARDYITEIRKIQPQGPYQFAGLCYGGMLAFEMARQLEQLGEKVALCLMVNNYAPLENQKVYRMTKSFQRFVKMNLSEKLNYAIEKNISIGRKIKDKAMSIISKKKNGNSLTDSTPVQEDIRVIHSLAILAYHPASKYNGDIFIIRAGGPIEDPEFYDTTLGWRSWVNGKIEIVQIEGSNNDTIIEDEQYNRQLASFIREKLNNTAVQATSNY